MLAIPKTGLIERIRIAYRVLRGRGVIFGARLSSPPGILLLGPQDTHVIGCAFDCKENEPLELETIRIDFNFRQGDKRLVGSVPMRIRHVYEEMTETLRDVINEGADV